MTRINRIVLHGFKSFADKVAIPFPSGFTVICGPNGSGKSNICDAIMFGLGISSAKVIRAERLSDVIFRGSKKRKPAKYCTVSIYLDNKDRKLPYDDEIKITRKINEKGLSIIRINGKVVTRSKMLDLLSNLNISPYGHNIIMQGDITKVIETSPKERRELIDQISGIAEFDEKKRKSELELEKVEKHINEMKIVLIEKEKLLERLKKEKEYAEKSIFLNEEIKKIRYSIALKSKENLQKDIDKINEKIEKLKEKLEELDKKYSEKQNELEKSSEETKKLNEIIIQKARNIELLRKIDQINMEIIRKKDKIDLNEALLSKEKSENILRYISNIDGVIGTLQQLIEIPKEYSVAIKVAIGNHLNDIVVENENVAIECIKFLKEKKIGRARFLPLDKIKTDKREEKISGEIIDKAINLVKFDPKYRDVIEYVLGDTVIIENIEKKIDRRIRAVTLDGDLIEPYGAIVGGYNKRAEFEKRILEENERLLKEIEKLEGELKKLREEQKKEEENLKRLEEERSKFEIDIDKIRKELNILLNERLQLTSELNKLTVNLAKKETELENIEREIKNFKTESYYDYEINKLKSLLSQYINELNSLGLVNMRAAEEFEIIRVEYEELKKRLEKLIEEKDSILKAIQEIESKKKEKFMETLKIVSENFANIYKDLVGGEGRLRLEDENDINSGLIIEASTTTRVPITIDAMSGGEKTMTAIAFLFAIQQYYACPFYILDEIDAALDKVNTKKAVEFLKKYSEKTQLIAITHNDLTIQEADHVFGVSMEDGVSKVFSIKMPKGD
jgi:chromosome segregation protein